MIIRVQDIAVVLVDKIGDRCHYTLLFRALGQKDRAVLVAHCERIHLTRTARSCKQNSLPRISRITRIQNFAASCEFAIQTENRKLSLGLKPKLHYRFANLTTKPCELNT